jgi:hypothetical protein
MLLFFTKKGIRVLLFYEVDHDITSILVKIRGFVMY